MPSLWNISRRQVSQTVSGKGGGAECLQQGGTLRGWILSCILAESHLKILYNGVGEWLHFDFLWRFSPLCGK